MTDEPHDALYLRVSSKSQKEASQLPDLTRFAKSIEGPAEWYKDQSSGTTMQRPAWDRLHAAIRAGKVRRVIVWRLDRLGRTAAGLTALFDELVSRKVDLVSIRDGFDLMTPAGRMMAGILASVAQYETEVRRERQTAGIAAAKAAGKSWGGNTTGGRRLKVTPEQVDQVRRLKAEGQALARIARATGLSRPTIYSILGDAS